MLYFRHSRIVRLVLLPLTLVALLPACHKWSTLRSPIETAIDAEQPDPVRLTLSNGRQIVLSGARIEADSVIGFTGSSISKTWTSLENPSARGRIAVPLEQVQRVDGRRTSVVATAATALGVAFIATTVIVCGQDSNAFGPC